MGKSVRFNSCALRWLARIRCTHEFHDLRHNNCLDDLTANSINSLLPLISREHDRSTLCLLRATPLLRPPLPTSPSLPPSHLSSTRPEYLMHSAGAPLLVPPSPPPRRRGFQLFTVRPRSTSTTTRRPSIFFPSAYL